jgi:hypothetical protein
MYDRNNFRRNDFHQGGSMRRTWTALFRGALLMGALAAGACASAGSFARIDHSLERGNYSGGVELLEKDKPSLYGGRDTILYCLDKGMLSHYAGQYGDSSALLENGERAIEAAFTKSLSMEIGTYLLNDNTRDYPGEDYEDIYLNAFNALNYYHRGNTEEALVEIRRMHNKIRYLSTKYGAALAKLRQKAQDEALGQIPDKGGGAGRFTDSALARYLGILFYRGAGLADDARIDQEGLRAAFAASPAVYAYPLPSSVSGELAVPEGMARLNVIAFSGLSPVKEEQVLRLPLPGARWVKIAVPGLSYRRSEVQRIAVAFDSGGVFNLELLEDMEAVARETFKARQDLIYGKTAIRAMLKSASSAALGAAADEVGGDTGLILQLLSFFTQIFAEASEQADLRISRYFPARAHVGGINVKPGLYSFQVTYYGKNGREIASVRHENMRVRENALNLAEAVCLK